jgi:hypothetical protein
MPEDSKEGKYEVGYGKPPRHTRFQKGQSGNPKGRPRGSRNLATLVEDELRERVVVNEYGRRRRITKQEAMVKHLVNKAVSGDRQLIQLLLNEIRLIEGRGESSGAAPLEEADQQVLRQLHERMRRLMQKSELGGKEENGCEPD